MEVFFVTTAVLVDAGISLAREPFKKSSKSELEHKKHMNFAGGKICSK